MDYENGKTRKRRKRSLTLDLFKDYNSNSTLHGLKYLTESDISLVEKAFWLVTFLLSVVLCSWLIYNVWRKWQDSPVIVNFNGKMIPVWQVPFPSVTICPQKRTMAFIYNYTADLANLNKDRERKANHNVTYDSKQYEKLDNLAQVCGGRYHFQREKCNNTIVKDIMEVRPKRNDIFHYCRWRGELEECTHLFDKVLTSEGICYNFNGLSADEMFRKNSIQTSYKYTYNKHPTNNWSFKEGYTTKDDPSIYPRRGRDNGAIPDLLIVLKKNITDDDELCNGLNSGFKVYFHHPVDMPSVKMYHYSVFHEQTTSLAVNFKMITTSEKLKSYSSETRQCYFPSDRKLRYFQAYTQNNCINECRSNHTFAKCGCVPFYMPHSDSEQICCSSSHFCIKQAKEELADHEVHVALQVAAGNASEESCNCLPACDYVEYEAESTKSDFDLNSFYATTKDVYNMTRRKKELYDVYQFSRLFIYFKDPQFASMTRSELFGLTDFLANCGGLLGLFLGFSFLSIVEIIYYSSLRLFCIIRRERKKYNVTKISENIEAGITKF